jgi:hypothetical protein
MQFLIFFLVAFLILSIGCGYIGWRLIVPAGLHAPWNAIAWGAVVLLLLIPPFSILMERYGLEKWSDRFAWLGYVGLGLVSILITHLICRDVLWLVATGLQKGIALIREIANPASGGPDPVDPARRAALVQSMNLGIMGIAAGLTVYGIIEARRKPATREVLIPLPHLPDDLEGFRIVQISDVHAGLTVKRGFVETIVEQVNSLQPDLIAFTGDLADGSVSHLRDEVAPLAELRAPHGSWFITGNHEYYSGAEPWVEEAARLGFTVLLNQHAIVQRGSGRILLAGVTDYSGGDFIRSHLSDPRAAIAGAAAHDIRILLAHQPRSLYAALPLGFDLQISGHTHGGQFFPWNLAAAVGQPYIAGLHKHENMWVYVSRGTGYWGPPVRLAARSEVTVLILTKKA